MKKFTTSLTAKAALLVCALLFLSYSGFSQTPNAPTTSLASNSAMGNASSEDVSPEIKNMLNYYDKQVYFTQNQGQWDSKVLYKADFKLGQAVATKDGMLVGSFDPGAVEAQSNWEEREEASHINHTPFTEAEPALKGNGWMMNFINHSPSMTVEGNTKHSDAINYFDGNKSQSDVSSYQEIWYNNVYDNVDVRYYPSKDGSLEYDMICKAGFDKNAIAIKMDGISKVILKKDGSLDLKTSVGDMSLPTPVAYQNINGQRVSVDVHYVVNGNTVTFNISNFDATKTLLIDPIALRWATWLSTNSTGANHAHCVWIDAAGNIYTVSRVSGTSSATITTGAFDVTANGTLNMIVGKYNEPDTIGNKGERLWQTYVGGSSKAENNNPYAAQMGPDGNLYITGYTTSTDFPLSGGTAFNGTGTSINEETQGSDNIFVLKISPDGQSVKGAVVGGNGDDESYDLRFTSSGDVLVCGETESSNLATIFPGSGATGTGTTANRNYDVLVFRISSNLDTLTWMRNYGGSGTNVGTIIVCNPVNDDIYVAGYTTSTNFPTTSAAGEPAARQTSLGGTESGFIQKLNSIGTNKWSTYYQSASGKSAQILCMEFNTLYDEVYFGGVTTGLASTNISAKAYQTTLKGTSAFFVGNIDTNQTFVSGTYVGGTNTSGNNAAINMMGLNTDQNNDVYILAYTTSTAFPVTPGALQSTNMTSEKTGTTDTTEVFLKLYTTLDSLEFSSYYGGSFNDYDPVGERGIKFSNCRIYTLVTSESNNIPLTYGAINTTKSSSTSIYEPGLVEWSNPPDLLNNTITGSQYVCNGAEPAGFTGSMPSYSLPIISRDGDTSAYPSVNGSATSYQWQSSLDSINWSNIAGGTTQNLASNLIGALTQKTYFRRIISGDACIIAGAAEQTVIVDISSVGGTVSNVTCNGLSNGSITAVPTGPSPYKFTWNTNPVQTTATATNLAVGTYTVTVVDGSNCTYSNSFVVTQPTVLAETIASQANPTTCNGDNGSVTANAATGGTSPYTYAWTPSGGTGLTATNLAAGTYTITATDANNCTATATVVLSKPTSTLAASISSQINACYNESSGSATVKPTGGQSPYSYSWNTSPVQTGATASGLAAGTYTVTVTDANTCTATTTVIITQPSSALSASISSQTNVSCFGNNSGSATVGAKGGASSYSYSWNTNPVQTGATASGLTAGTYTATVTDANTCTATATVIITQPSAALSASISSQNKTNVSCFGNNTGAASATVSGGTKPYSYSWNTSPIQTSDTASNLAAGTYTVTVTDANSCSTTATVVITQPQSGLSASVSAQNQTNVSCFGNNSGSASATVSGGTKPYSYSWNTSPVQTSDTASNLAAGTYTVTVTDANKCSAIATVVITQPQSGLSASISAQNQTNVSCFGNNSGSAIATVNGGTKPYSYSWNTSPVQTSDTASNLAAGTYTVTVTDANSCSATATVVITQPQAGLSASISAQNQTNVSCFGNNTGSAIATVNGGTQPYSYSWNTSSVQTSDTASNLAAGTYTVTVTDANKCSAIATVVITQPQAGLSASISAQNQTNVSCFGNNTGSAIASVGGGTKPYSYSWNTSPIQTSDTASNLAAGTYTVTVTDASSCSATATVVITQPQSGLSASVSAQNQTNVSCFGNNSGSAIATVNGGTQPYSYSWNTSPVQTSDTASNLAAGTYTVTVTDASSCSATATIVITQPQSGLSASISAQNQTNVSCFGNNTGSAIATVNGGTQPYSYSWNTSPVQTSDTASNLAAGTYTVTVTDASSCSATATVVITQPQAGLSASISAQNQTNVSCFGNNSGSAIATVNGGTQPYSYSWNTSPVQTSDTASNLAAGTYTVTVTDASSCSATATIVITQPQSGLSASISAQNQTNVSCFGNNTGSAIATVNGGTQPYSYSWNTSPVQTSDTASNLTAGTYTVTVTDANSCSAIATVVITQPQAGLSASISAQNQTNVSCFGNNSGSASATVSGGKQPYSYSWNTSPVQTSDTASNLTAGTYTVTVTDANSCSAIATVVITQPQAGLSASISAQNQTNVSCFGNNTGSAIATVNGGTQPYSYSWNTSPVQTSDTASSLAAGTYTVTVTDANSCSATATVVITQPQAGLSASISAQNQTNVSCFGNNTGSAIATVNGGTQPYSYSWKTSPVQTTDTAVNLTAGTYTVTVTDANSCSAIATVVITQPQAGLSASISAQNQTNVSCFGNNTGSASATVSGGTQPYSYSWNTSPIQTSDTASNLAAGTYTVTVTDANSCSATTTVIITQPQAALSASITSQANVSCFGGDNGSATVTATGGTQISPVGGTHPYNYSWNTVPVQTTQTATNLSAGTYTVTITDSNNCTATATVVITQPLAALSASLASQTNVTCFGGAGSASVATTGGTYPYSYSWNTAPVQTTDTAVNLTAGTYTVTVTDSNNCTTTASVIITQPIGTLNASVNSQMPVSCFGGNNGLAIATVSAGTPPYKYSWNTSPVQTSDTAINLSAGTYTVTVTDSGNCITTASVVISQPQAALSASISSQLPVLCYGGNTGAATVTVSGGTQPYSYSWNTLSSKTADTANNLSAGSYTVTVTDANNCTTTASVVITQPQAALNASVNASSSTVCSSSPTTLSASVSGGTGNYTYNWTPGSANTDTIMVNPSSTATYTVTVTDANGCTASQLQVVNVNPLPQLSITAISQVICTGSVDTLQASGAVNYTWTPSTGIIGDTTGASVIASPTVVITYTVTGTDANGCSNTATTSVNVNKLPTVSLNGLNPSYCSNASTVTLEGVPPAESPYGVYSGNSVNGQKFSPDSAGVGGPYTITYTYIDDTTGCKNSASVPVTILAAPNIVVTPDSPAVCSGISVTLQASGASSYSWSPATGLSNTTGSSVTSNVTSTTIYTVTGTDTSGCSSSVSTTVDINVLPVVVITPINPSICLGNSITLNASGGTSYTWSPATGLSCTNCSSTVASPTLTTQYIVDVNNGRCSASDTITVGVFSVTVKAGPDQHILYGSTAQLTASGAEFYAWSPGNTLSNDSISDPIASPTVTTTYTVTGWDSLGCISTDTVVIYVSNPCESLKIPTGFTPAGTENRYFHVLNVGGVELQEFKVFNRWGQLVYETTNINDAGWDGTFNGKDQPMGTYVYYAEILCQGRTVFIKGDVTLLR